MTGDLVTAIGDLAYERRTLLGDPAENEERCLDLLVVQQVEGTGSTSNVVIRIEGANLDNIKRSNIKAK